MKLKVTTLHIFLTAVFLTACNSDPGAGSETSSIKGTPEISFDNLEFNFGEITEGEMVACTFKFKNTGDADLLINSATTSCGCTVPRFDDQPIAPGKEGEMEVIFDSSHRQGTQTKTITVRSNARVKVVVLRITAEVMNDNH